MEKEIEKQNKHKRHRRPFHKKHHHKKNNDSEIKKTEELVSEAAPNEEVLVLEETKGEEVVSETKPAEADLNQQYRVVGIRFRPVGKTYSFDPDNMDFRMGDHVIVETSQGIEFGTVSTPPHLAAAKDVILPLKKVLRKASENDIKKNAENRELELKGRKAFQEKVQEHKLDMALSDVECSFDRSKLIFYFTSEGRVDFRDFVKDMASVFKTRIELRQIGVRDEAKQLGGLGICGRPLCCSSFLDDFQQVSIKMAKEQNLSLNPTKISGTCGRLMCCLRYENDAYVEASKRCPKVDQWVMTEQGKGTVTEVNILREMCKVRLDSDPEIPVTYAAKDLKVVPKQTKGTNAEKSAPKHEENSMEKQKI